MTERQKLNSTVKPSPPLAARGRSYGTDTRVRILAAGLKLFARHPYEAVTMDSVAMRARVAKGTLYLYFSSKEALYQEIVDDGFQELERNYPVDPQADVAEGLRRWMIAVIQFSDARRDFIRALGRYEEGSHSGLTERWRKRGMDFLQSLVEAGMERGVFRRTDSLLVSFAIAGAIRDILLSTSDRQRLEERGECLARRVVKWLMTPHR